EFPRAVDALTEAVRLAGSVPRFESCLGYAYARAGQRAEAEAILDRFNRGPLAPVISPVERGIISLGLGATEAAMAALEDAYEGRQPGPVVAGDPFFSELATEDRYRTLMERLGLPLQGA